MYSAFLKLHDRDRGNCDIKKLSAASFKKRERSDELQCKSQKVSLFHKLQFERNSWDARNIVFALTRVRKV